MTAYLLKFVFCSATLLVVYFLELEQKKMYRFNRFYLLFSILFSAIVPLISIELAATPLPLLTQDPFYFSPENTLITQATAPLSLPSDDINWEMVGYGFYGCVAVLMLLRFGRNIWLLLLRIKNNYHLDYQNYKIILIDNNIVPHSFWKYIFLSQDDYRQGRVRAEILCHELAHIRQKHSLDVVFVELMMAIAWFNPLLYWYRKAILLNHEFLADEAVIQTYQNTTAYQYLLLSTISQKNSPVFVSQFNYLITKKRLVMMNKTTTTARILWTQLAIVLVVATAIFVFSDVSIAQITTQAMAKTSSPKAISTQKGLSQEEMNEYQSITKKYTERKGNNFYIHQIPEKDNNRLTKLYLAMSEAQQASVEYSMFPAPPPSPRITPTEVEFESYKNAKIYGVWVDGKKVPNTALNNYKAADFHHVFVSKLYPNAQKTIGYKYKFQLDLETKDYYEKGRKEALANKKYYLMTNFKGSPKSK